MAARILSAARVASTRVGSAAAPPPPLPSPAARTRSESPVAPIDDAARRSTTTTITVIAPDRSSCKLTEGQSLVIGRLPGPGGLVIDNPEVSRRHVRLEVRMGMLVATELGSTNGTARVGRVSSMLERNVSQPLESGDRLVVNGDVLLCSVEIAEAAS